MKFQSFSKRLSLRLIIVVLLLMALMGAGMMWWTTIVVRNFNERFFYVMMDFTSGTIEKELRGVEVSTVSHAGVVRRHLDSPASVFKHLERNLLLVPRSSGILGYFAAFEPNYFPEEGERFEPYAVWRGDSLVKMRVDYHDYFQAEWYINGLKARDFYWSQPYEAETTKGKIICSCVVPLRDKEGKRVGIFGSDISLDWLHRWLNKKDIEMNKRSIAQLLTTDSHKKDLWTYSFIISNDGNYISHPNPSHIFKDNFYTEMSSRKDQQTQRMISEMKADKRGYAETVIDGVPVDIFYSQLEYTDWTMAIVVPKVIPATARTLFSLVLGVFILLALLLIYLFSRYTIQRTTRPLRALAGSANEVAKGRFDVPLPDIRYYDEIHQLRDAFGDMQQSLGQYVEQLKVTTAENAAYESEMSIARNIQMAMIPNQYPPFPERNDIDIFGTMIPAKSVGGDLFDFLLRDDHIFFCIGDVSGKGMPAALVMAVTRSLFRSTIAVEQKPEQIMMRINAALCDGNKTGMFVTMFIGVLDLASGHLTYCNAGHEAPLIYGSTLRRLPVEHILAAGILDDLQYKAQEIQLAPQETLLLFTDGLTEARNTGKEFFEFTRVMEVGNTTLASGQTGPREVIEQMMAAVNTFVDDASQSDDLTLLALQYKPL